MSSAAFTFPRSYSSGAGGGGGGQRGQVDDRQQDGILLMLDPLYVVLHLLYRLAAFGREAVPLGCRGFRRQLLEVVGNE